MEKDIAYAKGENFDAADKTGEFPKISSAITLSLTTCFMFFIYAPLELYFTNQNEFFYDIYILLPLIFLNFLIFFGISIVFFLIIRKAKLFYCCLYLYFIAFICSYIQGNFLAGWLPPIKGEMVDWNSFPLERIKSILLWVIVIGIFFAVYRNKGKIFADKFIRIVSICMGLMLLLTICILCISTGGYNKKQIFSTATSKDILTMSEKENFVILLLDAVDSPVLNEIITNESDQYKEIFEDFTYYTNAMGGYPYTIHSIPLILTGEWYEKQCDFEDFKRQAYQDSPLLKTLESEEYRMGIYEPDFVVDAAEQNRFDNILDCRRKVKSPFTFCRWQIQMTGYRYAPFDLKRFCYVYTNAFNTLKDLPEGEELFEENNLFFWDKLCNENMELVSQKCFRFIHVEGAHSPSLYDENMNVTEVSDYKRSVKACLTMTKKYIEMLHEAGIYDNTCIIVMADHGHGSGFNDNPILFVKGINEHHEMQINDAPISYDDLQEAYSRLLAGKSSGELFDYQEGDYRERRFLFQDDDDNPMEIMEEYVQKGHAGNSDTLIKIREF